MHIYEKDGKTFPSVTTIIHVLGNEELMRWSNTMGLIHRKYDDIMDKASTFGTLVHSHLQQIVDPDAGKPLRPPTIRDEMDIKSIRDKFSNFIKKFQYETIFTEKTIISEDLGYGGTLDWYAIINGYYMINDFKTSKAVRPTHLFQLGGYYNLLKSIGETPTACSIIIANRRTCQMYPFPLETLELFAEAFTQLAQFYKYSMGISPKLDSEFLSKLTTG